MWAPAEVIDFAKSCIQNGVKAVSLGGGEPLDYDDIFDVIEALYPLCYLTLTTNGLRLDESAIINRLSILHGAGASEMRRNAKPHSALRSETLALCGEQDTP